MGNAQAPSSQIVWDLREAQIVYEATRPSKMAARGKTDDRGVYRVGGLKPGRYYVRTRSRMMDEGSGAMPTFFKDVTPVEQARAVEFHWGSFHSRHSGLLCHGYSP
jgi:hypothetical protein